MNQAASVAAIVAVATAVSALLVPRRLRPDFATRLITALVLLSFGAAVWTLFLVVAANVVQLHGVAERLSWCSDLVSHHRGSFTPMGLVALGAAVAAFVSVSRVRMRQRRERAPDNARDLAVIASDDAVAYALPGRPGQVVVSTGMLRSLDAEQRRVLIAHERAHLRRHHHRYVRLTELATAAIPVLGPLNGRLRFVIERWADEDAAAEIGDRALVASAIASAALASQSAPRFGLALADAGVVERVEIMLAEPSSGAPVAALPLAAVVIAGVLGLAASVVLIGPSVLAILGLCH
jgi:Zn-dependent protease with chaperone function